MVKMVAAVHATNTARHMRPGNRFTAAHAAMPFPSGAMDTDDHTFYIISPSRRLFRRANIGQSFIATLAAVKIARRLPDRDCAAAHINTLRVDMRARPIGDERLFSCARARAFLHSTTRKRRRGLCSLSLLLCLTAIKKAARILAATLAQY